MPRSSSESTALKNQEDVRRSVQVGSQAWCASLTAVFLGAVVLFLSAASPAFALPPQFFGLMWNGTYQTLESESDWEAIKHSGAKTLRIQAKWSLLDGKGNWKEGYAWEQTYDKYIKSAAERDITLLPYFYGRRTAASEQQFYLSPEWSEWLQFVGTFVQRYGRGGSFWLAHPTVPYKPVTVWEVWNETNLKVNNPGGSTVQPRNYAEFFIATSKKITEAQNAIRKSGEPADTKVLIAGQYQEAGGKAMSVWKYLEEIAKNVSLNNDFKAYNSGLSLHPYSFAGNETEKLNGIFLDVSAAREGLDHFDSAAKPIWITEMGWPVLGADEHGVAESEQASLLTNSFNWLKSSFATYNIELITWYFYRDSDLGGAHWDKLCGLRDINGVFRPSWWAYQAEAYVPPWPASSEEFGGNITSDPDVSSRGPGLLDVFAKSAANTLVHKWYVAGSGWSNWEDLGGIMTSGPGSVSWGANRVDVVARHSPSTMIHWWWDNVSGWHSEEFGGNITSDPDVSSRGPGLLDVFAKSAANTLVHKWYVAGSGWSNWEDLGGTLSSGPSSVSWGENRVDVVAKSTSTTMTHWWWDNVSGWHSEELVGNITSDPTISSRGPGFLDVYARSAVNTLVHRWYVNGLGWSNWEDLGGTMTSGPGSVSSGPNRIDLVHQSGPNAVTHWWWGS
jgi:hypothetical protein